MLALSSACAGANSATRADISQKTHRSAGRADLDFDRGR